MHKGETMEAKEELRNGYSSVHISLIKPMASDSIAITIATNVTNMIAPKIVVIVISS